MVSEEKNRDAVENVLQERLQWIETKLSAMDKIIAECKKSECSRVQAIRDMEKHVGAMKSLVENSGDLILENKSK